MFTTNARNRLFWDGTGVLQVIDDRRQDLTSVEEANVVIVNKSSYPLEVKVVGDLRLNSCKSKKRMRLEAKCNRCCRSFVVVVFHEVYVSRANVNVRMSVEGFQILAVRIISHLVLDRTE